MFGKKTNENDSLESKVDKLQETMNLIVDLLTDSEDKENEEEKEAVEETEKEEIEDKKNEEEVDKRENIDNVGGFLKSKGLNDEDIRYVMKLMEKNSYENEEEKEEEEEKKVIIKNACKKNSLSLKEAIKNEIKNNSIDNEYKTRAERIKETNNKIYNNN